MQDNSPLNLKMRESTDGMSGNSERTLDGTMWQPKNPLAVDLDVSARKLGMALAGLPTIPKTIQAPDARNNVRVHYHVADGEAALDHRFKTRGRVLEKPEAAAVDENGFFTDELRRKWCTTRAFYENLHPDAAAKTSEVAIRRRAGRQLQSREAIDRIGRDKCSIFLFDELAELSVVKQERKADRDGIYTDPKTGKQWASLNTWESIFRVSQKSLMEELEATFGGLESMERLKVFNTANREDEMFSSDQVERALSHLFEDENLEVNGVVTRLEEVAGGIRESIHVTAPELAEIIPADRVARYMFYRKLKKTQIEAKNRSKAGVQPALSLQAAITTFGSKIADILASTETTDDKDEVTNEKGRWIPISKFLNERQSSGNKVKNPRRFIANTDQTQRMRRMNSKNELTYLYLESELEKVAKSI